MLWQRGRTRGIRGVRTLPRLVLTASTMLAGTAPAFAQPPSGASAGDIVLLSAMVGTVGFAVLSAIALIRARNRAEIENQQLRLQVADLKAVADRAEALADAEDQRLVAWSAPGEPPIVLGRLPQRVAPQDRAAFLAFGTWLSPEAAKALDAAVAKLRERGEAFSLTLETAEGNHIEATGRTAGGRAVLRFRDLTGDRRALAELEARHARLSREVAALRSLLEAVPHPAWIRGADQVLQWVNPAYARAVEAADPADALSRSAEFLDSGARQTIRDAQQAQSVFARRMPAIVAGARASFDVVDVASPAGSAGIAFDVSAIEAAQGQVKRLAAFQARTLDQLATAVAVFGADRRLSSSNAAFRALFGLDATFLESHPDEAAVLERMRAARKLPEQADFRSWRGALLKAWESLDAQEDWWHLPDGQTLRVIANPHPDGGLTWVYENVTQQLELESRYNALARVQGETLDHLAEGVAVFGSDGRLRLHNPAFARIWSLDRAILFARPHVSEIVHACRTLHDAPADWERLMRKIAGVDEDRAPAAGRMERRDGRVIDHATVPLPEGQTLVTFVDVTDSVQVERALVERNEALEAGNRMKTAFLRHVNFELRSPLTTIIGFAQMLADRGVGPLNDKQSEYVGYISASSASLLAIVNDILDLATVEAGAIVLDYTDADPARVVGAVTEGLADRMRARGLTVETKVAQGIGRFVADEKRLRQIVYNLVANAIEFSEEGGRITITVTRRDGVVEFVVADTGHGMPPDLVATAFERFESRSLGSGRGGAGLGLAIVKSFVELHRGTVSISSEVGRGTTVTVRLPPSPVTTAEAAE